MTPDEKQYLDDQFATINRRLDRMDGRLDRMDGRLDGVGGRLDGLSREVRKLGLEMESKYQNVQLLAEQFSTLQQVTNDKIDALAEKVDQQIGPLRLAVQGLYGRQSS